MLAVGLTGGIGAGKSTVARQLAALGAVVVDADAVAREVVLPGTPGLAAVVEEFGAGVLAADGSLDRPALARLAFADDARRAALNAVLHPRIAARTRALLAQAPPDAVVVHDVPLLVENRLGPDYHLVVVVEAPEDLRRRRLVEQRGMSEQDAAARLRAQAGEAQRRAAADVLLDTSGPPERTAPAVRRLWQQRLLPFEENVRLRRPVHGLPTPVLVPPDPGWEAAGARLAARVLRVVQRGGLDDARVEHIGSTSLSGVAAKGVIDLQLAVPSLADADAVRPALEDAGFPHDPAVTRDRPKRCDPDPQAWGKRFHRGTDPAVPLHLHVRRTGSPGWRLALLLRDWLRAQEQPRREYEQRKRELAQACPTTAAYAQAKEPWFDAALPRAEEWAARTGWVPPAG